MLLAEVIVSAALKPHRGHIFAAAYPEAGEVVKGVHLDPDGHVHDVRTSPVVRCQLIGKGGFDHRYIWEVETLNSRYTVHEIVV